MEIWDWLYLLNLWSFFTASCFSIIIYVTVIKLYYFSYLTVDCLQRYGMFSETPNSPRAGSLVRQGSNASYLSTTSADLNLDSISSGNSYYIWPSNFHLYLCCFPEMLRAFIHIRICFLLTPIWKIIRCVIYVYMDSRLFYRRYFPPLSCTRCFSVSLFSLLCVFLSVNIRDSKLLAGKSFSSY